jgi:TetR/AcrR family transcriptional regulator, cholesterol catabolism regulator
MGDEDREDRILDVVLELIRQHGDEAVQVRRVAADASISLATLYKHVASRDDLIIKALARWMAENVYAHLGEVPTHGSAFETFSGIVHRVFQPWEREPNVLAAFIRARMGPGGAVLTTQGMGLVQPIADKFLEAIDPDLLEDLILIVDHVLLAALARFAAGELEVKAIVPIVDRTLARVLGVPAPTPKGGRRKRLPDPVLAPLRTDGTGR